ncbi:MFS transporter [Myroides odoratimimus]|uniref:MFS transporter n=1 Tax=Myroides odoratimimus TaxID=76832 RepID=UPI002575B145|nr:MFS transporter [Myroides odoratimimus]MDM1397395.1 MFS transporter [Myroides odoratimimus]
MQNISTVKKRIMLFLISMSIFLSVLDLFIVNVAIPKIKVAMEASVADIQFIIVYYVIGYGAFLITSGKVGVRYGHKRIFVLSMFSFGLFSLLCGLAWDMPSLNIFRLFQGISGAFMIPQGVTLLSSIFVIEEERRRAYSIYGAIAGISSVLGQVLGGLLPDLDLAFGAWRLIFLINVPIAFVVGVLAWIVLIEIERKRDLKIQPLAQLLLVCLLVMLMYSLVTGADYGWTTTLLLVLVSAIIGIVLFLVIQFKNYKTSINVLIDFKPFTYRTFTVALVALIFFSLVQDSYFFIYANHFQLELDYTATHTGFLFAFQGVGYVIASFLSLKFLSKYQERFMLLGLLLMIVGLAGHYWLLNREYIPFYEIAILLFEYGIGCGVVLPSLFTYALSSLPTDITSIGSSLYLTLQQISIALGVSIVGQSYFGSIDGHFNSTVIMIVLLLVTCFVLFMSYKRRLKN